ncbi:hypothetical protein AB6O49_00210 [Streptomyces sp. SBR177]
MTADPPVSPIPVAPAGLTRRAKDFVESEGIRLARQDLGRHRGVWAAHGIPAAEIDRAVAFEDRSGGLRRWARTVTRLTGEAVDSLDLEGYEPVPEVGPPRLLTAVSTRGVEGRV